MQSKYSSEQDALIAELDGISSLSLLKRGLTCFEQGNYAEGVVLFRLARERLFPDQIELSTALDALNQATTSHLRTQQALHEASKRFAESDIEQQAQIAALKKLLPIAVEDTLPATSPAIPLRNPPRGNQSLRLLAPPPSTNKQSKQYQTSSLEDRNAFPALYITCFGRLEVRRSDPSSHPISLCTNLKGQMSRLC